MPKLIFIEENGNRREVEAEAGYSIMETAQTCGVAIEGACGGSMACATCHVIVDPAWSEKLPAKTPEEEDMLDLAPCAAKTSRLGCQIVMNELLSGIVVALPGAAKVAFPPDGTS